MSGDDAPKPQPQGWTPERIRLVDQIVEQLRNRILDGSFPRGTRLVQQRLAEDLGVSRTPLREALRVLEQDGLVTLSAASSAAVVAELSDDDVRELYELREVLDGLAARLAAERALPADAFGPLDAAVASIVAAVRPVDTARFLTAHVAFHVGLVQLAGNRRLEHLLPTIRISAQMLYPVLARNPERLLTSAHEHAAILDAVRRGDGDEAERLARAHIRSARAAWVSLGEAAPRGGAAAPA